MSMDLKQLPFGEIQYIPDHRCPTCGAPGEPYAPLGPRLPDAPAWIGVWRYYGEDMSPVMKGWEVCVGYVLFHCRCPHHSGRSLRVAHLGDAFLPLTFVDDWNSPCSSEAARTEPSVVAALNRALVARTVQYLAEHADPGRLGAVDRLRRLLFAVASGDEPPEHAYHTIRTWAQPPAQAR